MKYTYPLLLILTLLLAACTIDEHLKNVVKVDDPILSENENDFIGMVTTFFPLNEGESTLIRFPNGKKLLIDTGSAQDASDLIELLQERKVTKLDYVIITNDLPNHAGGYQTLANSLQIDTVMIPEAISRSIRHVVPIGQAKKLVLLREGDELAFDHEITIKVLNPSEPLFLSPQDHSLVFLLRQNKIKYLFTSGIGEKSEERLLERHPKLLRAEILKVANQGSNQASSQVFLSKVDAQVAVIESGILENGFKGTQSEIMERLSESWAETYVTGQHGTITILSNGKDYKVLKRKKE
ncbi:ComEC/Rec2 family competence protein [Brevibacillus ginsengisoli]|uniref:ComEC/Rec2 family competence protein n=1 Tax=Brevibacillus ginsengisoli TaxID=363854 RepID=UPI003CF8546B